jgi:drug/metabolite transporter (DMT)-like permease
VVTIVRPGTDLFDWAALLPITSSLLYAVAMILTRRIGGHETAPAMSTWGNLVFLSARWPSLPLSVPAPIRGKAIAVLAFLMRGWTQPSWSISC